MPKGPTVTIIIDALTEGLEKGLGKAEDKLGGFQGTIAGIGTKALGVAGVVAAVGGVVLKLGSDADKTATQIEGYNTAMGKAGASAAELAGPLADATKASADLAFTGGETRDALLALQTATGDATKSADLLATAQDVARLAGVDLTVAADAVAKAHAGQDRALRSLIPGMKKTESGAEAIAEAERLAAGQADNFADSSEALGIKAKMAFGKIANTVGKAVAPALNDMLKELEPLLIALGELLESVLPLLIPLFKLLAKMIGAAARAITDIIKFVNSLIDAFKRLIAPIQEVINKIGQIDLNPFNAAKNAIASAPTVGVEGRAATAGVTPAPVTINIYGDPAVIEARVIRALRGYQARNGVGAVFSPGRA